MGSTRYQHWSVVWIIAMYQFTFEFEILRNWESRSKARSILTKDSEWGNGDRQMQYRTKGEAPGTKECSLPSTFTVIAGDHKVAAKIKRCQFQSEKYSKQRKIRYRTFSEPNIFSQYHSNSYQYQQWTVLVLSTNPTPCQHSWVHCQCESRLMTMSL